MLKILEPGLHTTVQDMGRYGHYHLGMPPSGAADKYSFMIGNLLLGNPIDYAGLEMTLLGPKIQFQKRTVFALTGAPMEAFLNNKNVPYWEAIQAEEGDILSFKFSKQGIKTYLCISGGIQVPVVMGSRSTYILSQLGGFAGRKLEAEDILEAGETLPGVFKQVGKQVPQDFLPLFKNSQELRVVMGLSSYRISDEGIKAFLNSEWTVSTESNRVAYRYTGATLAFKGVDPPFGAGNNSSNVVDIAYPIGAVMAPNQDEIIVLLNDATSGGGFVTIGTVISTDLDLIAQSRPQTKAKFIALTVDQAMEVRRNQQKKMAALTEILKV
ncbi:biotin-dependent carboxyltransferase family protein [Ammoniphilus sp. CFH 90114]|uniref:5-oxoprolinase subunit C family protein n=1 Tax=Ammoniphilus sp. CFH 90114 TaxID=2493665 RepID=UPI00100ED193|nr:biotin-dependent carboxyltransferase family protein [Ammoniphilus sp. CFH 90114]RXT06403.1 biotin-dependent carboxyltransferase [Ammoniphilus sp. CFH 90114]